MIVSFRSIVLCTGLASALAPELHAQQATINIADRALRDSSQELKSKSANAQIIDGYTVAPGVIVSLGGATEFGYDSNPNLLDAQKGSSFLQTSLTGQVTYIQQDTLARMRVQGVALDFQDTIPRNERGVGQGSFDVVKTIMPGLSLSLGGLYRYNGIPYVEEQVAGGYAELTFNDNKTIAFLRGRFAGVQYLTDLAPTTVVPAALAPLYKTSAYDVNRSEVGVGLLFNANAPVAPFFEGALADIDYVHDDRPSALHRSGTDAFAKAGLRVSFAPSLQTDLGWRLNHRDVSQADVSVPSFSSDYFDFALRWTPTAFFNLHAAIDRTIDEPSVAFSRLADTRTYAVGFSYAATSRITVSANLQRRLFDEVGGNAFYRTWQADAEASYSATKWAQYYVSLLYQSIAEERNDSQYDRFRVGAGLRLQLGETARGPADVFVASSDPDPRLNYFHGAIVSASVGYAWFKLPEKSMTTVVGGKFFDEAKSQLVDHDGDMQGVRTALEVDRLGQLMM